MTTYKLPADVRYFTGKITLQLSHFIVKLRPHLSKQIISHQLSIPTVLLRTTAIQLSQREKPTFSFTLKNYLQRTNYHQFFYNLRKHKLLNEPIIN